MLCTMMYCSGLPILYPFACCFFTVNYWLFKYLLVSYYKVSTKFNEELAVASIPYIKAGIFLHVITSMFFFTNPMVMMTKREWNQQYNKIVPLTPA